MKNKCSFCNSDIQLRKKYCNSVCYRNKLKHNLKKICENCNNTFQASHKIQRFCSNACASQKKDQISISQKRIKTLMSRYGVSHQSKLPSFISKVKKTKFNKYGAENYVNSEKAAKTRKLKYGTENAFQFGSTQMSELIKNKYGVENISSLQETRNKVKSTMIAKYGVPYVPKIKNMLGTLQRNKAMHIIQDCLKKANITLLDKYDGMRYVGSDGCLHRKYYNFSCNFCGRQIEHALFDKIPVCKKCNPSGSSKTQTELENFILEICNIKFNRNCRKILTNKKELDLYFPDKKLAIEFDGIIWHSEGFGCKDKNYHLNKTKDCQDLGINLIHIFESEWEIKKEIVKSIIQSKLGITKNKIYARNCTIRDLNSSENNTFLQENHLQGADKSSIRIGLVHNDSVVAAMTFGRSRYNKKYQWEIYRFCTKLNTSIPGAASKLFKYFIKLKSPNSIITYCDRRYSVGNLYSTLGFSELPPSPPNYFYFLKKSALNLHSRMQFQKHLLKKTLQKYDDSVSEWKNMQLNGYDRIWDCGNLRYEWKTKEPIQSAL